MLASYMAGRTLSARAYLLGALVLVVIIALLPGCSYLVKAARGHFKLMSGSIPLSEALERSDLSEDERDKLRWVPRIKSFGEEQVGLEPSRNYESINPDFNDVVWNVSGCAADRFEPHIYRYPIVGKLPYIGYFDHEDALEEEKRLREMGLDTWVRPAGAYSTLGWFRDPIWRSMLAWDVDQLANTVLHELAHSTLWLKGQGRFNESFASFVGDSSSELFMESLRESRPELWQRYRQRREDRQHSRRSYGALVDELAELYDSGLDRDAVLKRKAEVIAAARVRHRSESWQLTAYSKSMNEDRVLNNARLMQFTVYNTGTEVFSDALERFGGDLPSFLHACQSLTGQRRQGGRDWDPYAALAELQPGPSR